MTKEQIYREALQQIASGEVAPEYTSARVLGLVTIARDALARARTAAEPSAPTDATKTDLRLAQEAAERVQFDGSLRQGGSARWKRDLLTLCHFALFGENNQGWPSQSSENRRAE